MPALTYRITTLGCRVNHAEARDIESVLVTRGLRRAAPGDPADLEVVHTCSVTNTAAAKSRQAIRRAARGRFPGNLRTRDVGNAWQESHPNSGSGGPKVIVTGCFTSTDTAIAARLAGRPGSVIEHDATDHSTMVERLAGRLDEWLDHRLAHQSIRNRSADSSDRSILPLPVVDPTTGGSGHVRAELKIQDGCDAHCSFCIIPGIRRTLRSKTIPDAVAEARKLIDLGHLELVLTGIFIGAYGHETALRRRQMDQGASPLADLVDAVARIPGLQRLRISSMEPGDVNGELLDAMAANQPVVVPHLHLPLQSGSGAILRAMNRQYRVGEYLEMIEEVNGRLTTPDGLPPALTTDIICGFPNETRDDFEKTLQVADHVGYLHMHVFPFSPRTGTAAARWTDRFVPETAKKSRVRELIDLEDDPVCGLSMRYRSRLLGRTVRVILEQPDRARPGSMTGRCDQYAQITVPTVRPRGSLIHATVTEIQGAATVGCLAGEDVALPVLA